MARGDGEVEISYLQRMSQRKSNKRPYLTKRILLSAARNAADETMEIMGFTIIAQDGWVVKKYANGRTERLTPIKSGDSADVVLD